MPSCPNVSVRPSPCGTILIAGRTGACVFVRAMNRAVFLRGGWVNPAQGIDRACLFVRAMNRAVF